MEEADVATIFSNTEEVMTANKALLSRFLARKETDPKLQDLGKQCSCSDITFLGSTILETADSFKVYSIYCGNYPRAMKRLTKLQEDPSFKQFLQVIYFRSVTNFQKLKAGNEAKGLSLESFLVISTLKSTRLTLDRLSLFRESASRFFLKSSKLISQIHTFDQSTRSLFTLIIPRKLSSTLNKRPRSGKI